MKKTGLTDLFVRPDKAINQRYYVTVVMDYFYYIFKVFLKSP